MLGIPIVRGRDFTEEEVRAGAKVAIVTEATAQKALAGRRSDRKDHCARGKTPTCKSWGLRGTRKCRTWARSAKLYVYLPAGPKEQSQLHLMIHGGGGFAAVAAGVRGAASGLDPDVMVDVTRLEDNMEVWRTPARIVAALAGSLGALGCCWPRSACMAWCPTRSAAEPAKLAFA